MHRSPLSSRAVEVLAALLCLTLAPTAAAPQEIFRLQDPRGDDHGDGTLVYPLRPDLARGDLDLVSFSARATRDGTEFEATFAHPIRDPGRQTIDAVGTSREEIARFGFYTFNIDVYIDTDRAPGSGSTSTLPGRKATIAAGSAWEKAVILTPRPYEAQEAYKGALVAAARAELKASSPRVDQEDVDLLERKVAAQAAASVHFPTRVTVSGTTVRFLVPEEFLGGPAKETWGYVVAVSGADMRKKFNISFLGVAQTGGPGVMILPIVPGVSKEAFGGARDDDTLQPPLVDVIVPAGARQEVVLKDYDLVGNRPVALPGVVPAADTTAGKPPATVAAAGGGVLPQAAPAAASSGASQPGGARWRHDWARGAVFYEVFVRSFADSNGDGVGDFDGLISKLDYLNDGDPSTSSDLGVDALWLMPVFKSPSYHGYDVTDYEHVNPDYGTDAGFDRLLSEAHRRGMKVIVDFVMNHTSDQHPWFVESASSPASPKRDWYVWRSDDPGWTQPWGRNPVWHRKGDAFYYGLFWGGMPDLNFRTPGVRAELERLAATWLGRGLDGFRLDATRHLVETGPGEGLNDALETHTFLKDFSAAVRRLKPEAVLVGENWTSTAAIAKYYGSTTPIEGGDELPMNFNFPLADAIVKGAGEGQATGIASILREMASLYPAGVIDAPFLTNHDMPRVATQLGADAARLRLAAAILLTLPGAPFLYYGEEVGLQNGPGGDDQHKRTPMPWDATATGGFTTARPWFPPAPGGDRANVEVQQGDKASLLSRYRDLIRVRRASAALREGGIEILAPASPQPSVLAFVRRSATETVLVVHNLGGERVTAGPWPLKAASCERLLADPGAADPARSGSGWSAPLPPHGSGIWRCRPR
jgi:glycosidase